MNLSCQLDICLQSLFLKKLFSFGAVSILAGSGCQETLSLFPASNTAGHITYSESLSHLTSLFLLLLLVKQFPNVSFLSRCPSVEFCPFGVFLAQDFHYSSSKACSQGIRHSKWWLSVQHIANVSEEKHSFIYTTVTVCAMAPQSARRRLAATQLHTFWNMGTPCVVFQPPGRACLLKLCNLDLLYIQCHFCTSW